MIFRKQIDTILQEKLFKPETEDACGKETMIEYINLKWVLAWNNTIYTPTTFLVVVHTNIFFIK